jgi:hypothetical protein
MPYFAITRGAPTPDLEKSEEIAMNKSHGTIHRGYLEDDVSQLDGIPPLKGPTPRRNYFASSSNRKKVTYRPQVRPISLFISSFLY